MASPLRSPGTQMSPVYQKETGLLVPMRGFEPRREYSHYALNVARLPVPPHRLGVPSYSTPSAPPVKQSSGPSRTSGTRGTPLAHGPG